MTTPNIMFENPPELNRSGGTHARHAELVLITRQLTERPGQWARISTHPTASAATSVASQIRHGKTTAFHPAGAFEAVARTVDGQHRVYARYVGSTPAGGDQA